MPRRPLVLVGALLAAVTATTSAAEGELKDLRVVGSYSLYTDAVLQGGGVDEGFDELDTWSIALQGVRSLGTQGAAGGAFYGGELFYARGAGDIETDSGTELSSDSTTWGLTGMLGWAYVLAQPGLHVELAGYGRIGQTDTTLYTYQGTPTSLQGDDAMEELGLRAASYWTFAERHQIGVELRYAFLSRTNPTVSQGANSVRLEVESNGLSIGVGAGFRY